MRKILDQNEVRHRYVGILADFKAIKSKYRGSKRKKMREGDMQALLSYLGELGSLSLETRVQEDIESTPLQTSIHNLRTSIANYIPPETRVYRPRTYGGEQQALEF